MSPRAAWRLEGLGFTRVFDYAGGKSDWAATGLATEGKYAMLPRPGHLAVRDVPTCGPSEEVRRVAERPDVVERGFCIVTTPDGVVLGRLRKRHLQSERSEAPVADVMEAGPTTVRFDEFLPELTQRMAGRGVGTILVTTPEGTLIGVLYRKDAEKLLQELEALHHEHEHDHEHDHDHDH